VGQPQGCRGRNLFQGGFLGLDNIALFDRSAALPPGYLLDQADGTAWVAAYALDLMRMGLELAKRNGVYVDISVKFFEHFLYIAGAINRVDDSAEGLWDEQDLFSTTCCTVPMARTNRCACAPSSV
jgi:hypothetical protein